MSPSSQGGTNTRHHVAENPGRRRGAVGRAAQAAPCPSRWPHPHPTLESQGQSGGHKCHQHPILVHELPKRCRVGSACWDNCPPLGCDAMDDDGTPAPALRTNGWRNRRPFCHDCSQKSGKETKPHSGVCLQPFYFVTWEENSVVSSYPAQKIPSIRRRSQSQTQAGRGAGAGWERPGPPGGRSSWKCPATQGLGRPP